MAHRPQLSKGDLVKRKKPYDDGTMYRVVNIFAPIVERMKLGLSRRGRLPSSEGFLDIRVKDLQGNYYTFRRRELWRIPNQPRHKKRDEYRRELIRRDRRVPRMTNINEQ
jgi:hypothetical protein